jgi:hypothetical protein
MKMILPSTSIGGMKIIGGITVTTINVIVGFIIPSRIEC